MDTNERTTKNRTVIRSAGNGVVLNGITVSQLQNDLNTVSGYSSAGKDLIGNTAIIGASGAANSQYILPASTPGVFGSSIFMDLPSSVWI